MWMKRFYILESAVVYIRGCVSFCRREFFMKTNAIAPIVVEILLCRGSARKIVTDSGIKLLEKI